NAPFESSIVPNIQLHLLLMKPIMQLFTWQRTILLSIIVLVVLDILSFYGLYTNRFYFLKFDNFIFPILTIAHFVYLYVLWFKIKEGETADVQMRNVEYLLYTILLVYLYKLVHSFMTLMSYTNYEDHVMPSTFLPMGTLILILHVFLMGLTFLAFKHRKELVGGYSYEEMEKQHIDQWE
ncbi:MAG: hypothetical protein AB3N16_15425, partial [Flavobacteriaceae bacterium]